jgi:hypothetical protein
MTLDAYYIEKYGRPVAIAAVTTLLSIAVSVPTFVYLKNRNDSAIVVDTRRVADALVKGVDITVRTNNPNVRVYLTYSREAAPPAKGAVFSSRQRVVIAPGDLGTHLAQPESYPDCFSKACFPKAVR